MKRKPNNGWSEGHKQVYRILKKMGYSVYNEYYIDELPYDIYIKELNLIIEYYGNRWHYPESQYEANDYDYVKNRYVWEKWEKDYKKVEFAKLNKHNIEVIWELDWKKISNKSNYLNKLCNKYKEVSDEYSGTG